MPFKNPEDKARWRREHAAKYPEKFKEWNEDWARRNPDKIKEHKARAALKRRNGRPARVPLTPEQAKEKQRVKARAAGRTQRFLAKIATKIIPKKVLIEENLIIPKRKVKSAKQKKFPHRTKRGRPSKAMLIGRRYLEKNREAILARRRARRAAMTPEQREAYNIRQRELYKAKPRKPPTPAQRKLRRDLARKWRAANLAHVLERKRKYRSAHREKEAAINRRYHNRNLALAKIAKAVIGDID